MAKLKILLLISAALLTFSCSESKQAATFNDFIAPNGQPISIPPGKNIIPEPNTLSEQDLHPVTHQYGALTVNAGKINFSSNSQKCSSLKNLNITVTQTLPNEFVRLLQVEVGDNRRSLIFDKDPSENVVSDAVVDAELEIKEASSDDKVFGQLTLDTLSGTSEVYKFTLTGEWKPKIGGANYFVADGGKWIGPAPLAKPDYLTDLSSANCDVLP